MEPSPDFYNFSIPNRSKKKAKTRKKHVDKIKLLCHQQNRQCSVDRLRRSRFDFACLTYRLFVFVNSVYVYVQNQLEHNGDYKWAISLRRGLVWPMFLPTSDGSFVQKDWLMTNNPQNQNISLFWPGATWFKTENILIPSRHELKSVSWPWNKEIKKLTGRGIHLKKLRRLF